MLSGEKVEGWERVVKGKKITYRWGTVVRREVGTLRK